MRKEKPTWLTETFVKQMLENGNDYTVTIKNLEVEMPVPEGSNYASDIFGAKVEYAKSNDLKNVYKTSFIIKAPLISEVWKSMANIAAPKEDIMYAKFSPKLNDIFNDNDQEQDNYLLPKSYLSPEPNVIVLEDLKVKGYKLADRLKQLDYDHCVLALKALAKFHAGSLIMHENEPEFIEKLSHGSLYSKDLGDDHPFKNLMENAFKLLAEELKNRPELKKYSVWLNETSEIFWDTFVDVLKPKENELNVLTHCDYRICNMLFKYDDNNVPVKVKIIDLQSPQYASPVNDFMYFVMSSAQEEVRTNQFEELVNVYLNEFNSILERLESKKCLEITEFNKLIDDRAICRIYGAVNILPFVMADPNSTEFLDLTDIKGDWASLETNPMKSYYKNEKYIQVLSKILVDFENKGIIKL